jgi:hypothetical protein
VSINSVRDRCDAALCWAQWQRSALRYTFDGGLIGAHTFAQLSTLTDSTCWWRLTWSTCCQMPRERYACRNGSISTISRENDLLERFAEWIDYGGQVFLDRIDYSVIEIMLIERQQPVYILFLPLNQLSSLLTASLRRKRSDRYCYRQ